MIVRTILLIMFALTVQPAGAAQTYFKCDADRGICTCDANVLRDCELMKKNCDDGKIGWCRPGTTKCSCALPKVNSKTLAPLAPRKMQLR